MKSNLILSNFPFLFTGTADSTFLFEGFPQNLQVESKVGKQEEVELSIVKICLGVGY